MQKQKLNRCIRKKEIACRKSFPPFDTSHSAHTYANHVVLTFFFLSSLVFPLCRLLPFLIFLYTIMFFWYDLCLLSISLSISVSLPCLGSNSLLTRRYKHIRRHLQCGIVFANVNWRKKTTGSPNAWNWDTEREILCRLYIVPTRESHLAVIETRESLNDFTECCY